MLRLSMDLQTLLINEKFQYNCNKSQKPEFINNLNGNKFLD